MPRATSPTETTSVQSVARASRLLKVLFASAEGKHLTELAQLIDVHKSTALRLLRTLIAQGLVHYDPDSSHYSIAASLWLQAGPLLAEARAYEAAVQALLRDLADRTGATAILFAPDATFREVVPVSWALPPRLVRLDPAAGYPAALNATAAGKCLLARLTEEELGQWMEGALPALTPNTITSPNRLREEVATVRARGFATNQEESQAGTSGIAVAIFAGEGRPAAALSLATASPTLAEEEMATWLGWLREAAATLSARFSDSMGLSSLGGGK